MKRADVLEFRPRRSRHLSPEQTLVIEGIVSRRAREEALRADDRGDEVRLHWSLDITAGQVIEDVLFEDAGVDVTHLKTSQFDALYCAYFAAFMDARLEIVRKRGVA